jgi:hypothetical protein
VLVAAAITGVSLIPRDTPRGDVARYIERANETGVAFAKQYKDVSSAYRSLSVAQGAQAAQSARLNRAARRLTALRIELQQLAAPPSARRLRLRLIAFYRQQEQVAHELAGIMAYFPQVLAAERPMQPAAARMRKALAKAGSPEAQAAVLGTYADAVDLTRERVRAIRASALLTEARSAELGRLDKTAQSIRAVQRGLRAHDRVQLQHAVSGLRRPSDAASAATRAAILAYNRHIAEIRRLGSRVEQERQRLDSSLG